MRLRMLCNHHTRFKGKSYTSPVAPEPIEECDDDNDGFTFFTLETNEKK